ncbi:SGNH/GDSL hydrolase family protein [Candidatus Cyanaurora vandensis]|uniref:SGNH/GDSL hydrolase family protein n=1 Tax=Candidatus Cyanaurora vandensis TaxID=2714958 RepID=UPI002579A6D9|nr:SGNH/GDSL hydrolase family protein [Candidatus Cyanaurora vandensis]
MVKRLRSLGLNLGLVLTSTLLGVGLLELGLRLVGPRLSLELQQALFTRATDEDLFTFVPGVGTMTRPDLNRPAIRINDTETITVQTDEFGFRNPTGSQNPDVAFLGDSFVWGFGVPQAATWVQQVGQARNTVAAGYGQSGFSAWQYRKVFEQYVAPQRPQVVIWSFFANDLQPAAAQITSQNETITTAVINLRVWLDSHSLIYRLVKFVIQGAYFSDQQPISYQDSGLDLVLFPMTHNIVDPRTPDFARGLAELEAGVSRVQTQCQAQDCQLVLVLIPTKEMVYYPRVAHVFTPEQRQLVQTAFQTYRDFKVRLTRQNIPHLDLTPALQQAALSSTGQAQQLYFQIDGHWNRAGHAVAARALAQFLAERDLPRVE